MVWNGFCTEYCGTSHANMRIRAYTVSPAEFDSWAANQKLPAAFGAVATPAAPPAGGAPATMVSAVTSSKAATTAQGKTPAAPEPSGPPAYVYPADKIPDYAIPKTPYPANLTFDDALLAKGDPQRGRDWFAAQMPKAQCTTCHMLVGIPGAENHEGPNLTHIASRHTIAAGLYPNDAQHLARWIKNAGKMKPGAHMNTWGLGEYDPITRKMMGEKSLGVMTDQQIADVVAFLQTLK
jgi:cytochrome c oxidase subunit 2